MNRDSLNKVLIFVTGAAVGAIASWQFLKTKYEQQVQAEVESVKQELGYFDRSETTEVAEPEDEEVGADDHKYVSAKDEMKRIIEENGYADESAGVDYNAYSKKEKAVKKVEEEGAEEDMAAEDKPYVISPEEFGENGYKTVSLTYYEDDVLTDERGKIIKDVDTVVGKDSLSTFGQYEDDSVFVRNDKHKTDYEILADERCYYDQN